MLMPNAEPMSDATPSRDADAAHLESEATRLLMDRGGSDLTHRPWLHERQPPSAIDLIQHLLWRSRAHDKGDAPNAEDLRAALTLMPAARGEMDAVETALIFLARSEGLTWAQIAESLGLRSAQAAQQRLDRLSDRPHTPAGPR
jgi:hypothetical protein